MLPTPEPRQWPAPAWMLPALLTLCGLGCAPANVEEQTYELQSCAEIRVQGHVNVRAQTGERNHLTVVGPSINGYRVEQHANGFALRTLSTVDAVEAVLTCRQWGGFEALGAAQIVWDTAPEDLHKVALYGASAARLKQLDAQDLDLRAAGASRLTIEEVLAEQINVMAAGASELTLAGSTTGLSIDAGGSSLVDAGALQAQNVSLQASGSSVLEVWASAHLSGRTKSGVTLSVRGNPDRDLQAGSN